MPQFYTVLGKPNLPPPNITENRDDRGIFFQKRLN